MDYDSIKICHCCFDSYDSNRSNSKYCSNACRAKAWRVKKEVEHIIDQYPDVKSQLTPEFVEYFTVLLLALYGDCQYDLQEECETGLKGIQADYETMDSLVFGLEQEAKEQGHFRSLVDLDCRNKYNKSESYNRSDREKWLRGMGIMP